MHKYLRAVGFSKLRKKSELKKLLKRILKEAENKRYVSLSDESIAVEYDKKISESTGIVVYGEYADDVEFNFEYFYPYVNGMNVSSHEEVTVEKRYDKDSYEGICDDIKLGISTIFYLQNQMEYVKLVNANEFPVTRTSVTLAAFSVDGSIMLPLNKTTIQRQNNEQVEKNRTKLIEAARNGDEEAMENLTLDDIDTYSAISRKIRSEDVYSLVDTYFMPYGIECDHYSVLGEIIDYHTEINSLTKELIYIITINCNGLIFDVCINKKDLVGEPAVKRRFKGIIWMQGRINFIK
ncbi:protein of unknown function [Lachnospiraceae bacterium KH1T2]|nr:protein of unknown function [Lachnospiraceae bacterium KH1T2]